MKKIEINFKNLSGKLANNLGWAFFAALLVLFGLEALVINNSVQIALKVKKDGPEFSGDKSVRINFENYNQVLERIQRADSFKPTYGLTDDPFTLQPVVTPVVAPTSPSSASPQPQSGSGLLQAP